MEGNFLQFRFQRFDVGVLGEMMQFMAPLCTYMRYEGPCIHSIDSHHALRFKIILQRSCISAKKRLYFSSRLRPDDTPLLSRCRFPRHAFTP